MAKTTPTSGSGSRRARPAKPALSRAIIVAAGLDLLRQDGIAGLSLRKVAQRLDTGAASLYVYLDNLDALHAQMLDHALGEVAIPAEGDWRQRLCGLLRNYLQVLHATPGLGQLAMMTMATGPNALRLLEAQLGLLLEGGLDERRAAWAVDALPLYICAIAAEQDLRRQQADPLAGITQALAAAPAVQYPHSHRLQAEMLAGNGEARLSWALDMLINGLIHTPRP